MNTRVLFVCKNRVNSYGNSIGLYNSASFVAHALSIQGMDTKVVCVHDNNCIDREVHAYNPTHVIIEALWVVPSKILQLIELHKHRQWCVRVHSKIPFLSMEGIATEWLNEYTKIVMTHTNFSIAANNKDTSVDISNVIGDCLYLPNICQTTKGLFRSFLDSLSVRRTKPWIDIGCFGAVRPLKNMLIQAFAAIEFANYLGLPLRFHMNGNRAEQKGEEVVKNIKALFHGTGHYLVLHNWMDHDEFLRLVNTMDIGLQVSFSESFNIVSSDFVSQNVPIVGSPDIEWLDALYQAETNSVKSIVRHLKIAWYGMRMSLQTLNLYHLVRHNKKAVNQWLEVLEDL